MVILSPIITLKNSCLDQAIKQFEDAERFCTIYDVSNHITLMKHYLQKGSLSLSDIPVTKEQIEKLIKTGYLSQAKNFWNKIKNNPSNGDLTKRDIEFMRWNLKKAGANFAQIDNPIFLQAIIENNKWLEEAIKYLTDQETIKPEFQEFKVKYPETCFSKIY